MVLVVLPCALRAAIKEIPDIIWVVCYKLTAVWTAVRCLAGQFLEMPDIIWVVHYKLTAVRCLASQLLEAYGGTSCGNGWRNPLWQWLEEPIVMVGGTSCGNGWRNQLWQWLEEPIVAMVGGTSCGNGWRNQLWLEEPVVAMVGGTSCGNGWRNLLWQWLEEPVVAMVGGTRCGNGWREDVLNLGDSHLGLQLPVKSRERLAHYWETLVPYMPTLFTMSNTECHTKQQCAHAAVCVMYLAINKIKITMYIFIHLTTMYSCTFVCVCVVGSGEMLFELYWHECLW